MADGIFPALAIRSTSGVEVWKSDGPTVPYVPHQDFVRDESKICRAVVFSPDGRFLAWANGTTVRICTTNEWDVVCSLPRPKVLYIKFSPKGTYLMTWEIYSVTKETPEGAPNLYVYKAETGEEIFAVVQKKQINWEPHWSSDETLFGLMIGGEVLFYDVSDPPNSESFKTVVKRLGGGHNGGFSIAPGQCPPHIAFYVPGVKGAPSMCKLYRYPNLDINQPIASKSFFQADNVEMKWNQKGTGLLLITSTDVDQTGVSYYGKQALHFMTIKGDSYAVQLNAEGPIHAVEWSPKSNEFCVVYGFIPSKATLFNLKCDSVHDFGVGVRNSIYYNGCGNLLLFGGFGNLRGNIEVWNITTKTIISSTEAPDSTLLEWSPTGEIYVTATTSPRLRMSNGFKVWHYSGALLHETMWPEKQELLEVVWQKYMPGSLKETQISNVKIEGIKSSQPQASKQKYIPPNIRNCSAKSFNATSSAEPQPHRIPGLPPGYTSSVTSRKERRTNQTRKSNVQNSKLTSVDIVSPKLRTMHLSPSDTKNPNQKQYFNGGASGVGAPVLFGGYASGTSSGTSSGSCTPKSALHPDSEKDKKIRKINQKLKEIRILNHKIEQGEVLNSDQSKKINSEQDLIAELKTLKAS